MGGTPELRHTQSGNPVATFSLASNERRKSKDGENAEVTTWFRVTVWGRRAELVVQYLSKGSSVYIEGRLRLENWTDREGKERTSLEVEATDVQFLGSGGGREDKVEDKAETATAQASSTTDDDLPF